MNIKAKMKSSKVGIQVYIPSKELKHMNMNKLIADVDGDYSKQCSYQMGIDLGVDLDLLEEMIEIIYSNYDRYYSICGVELKYSNELCNLVSKSIKQRYDEICFIRMLKLAVTFVFK